MVALPIRLLTPSGPNAGGQMMIWDLVLKPRRASADDRYAAILLEAAGAAFAGRGSEAAGKLRLVPEDADADSLAGSSASEKICLESNLLRGLGTGGDPERGRAVAEQHVAKLKAACTGADVVFIVTGLGGGAGTGVSPLLAHAAKEAGALVLAFATFPFDCEGNRRVRSDRRARRRTRR